jgi:hypothetical protein
MTRARRLHRVRALASVLALSATARAEPGSGELPAEPDGTPRVRFQADRLELDPRLEKLDLRGHVVVTADRYRFTSDGVQIEKTPRGVLVDGTGRVAFCPCPEPPVTLEFRSALVAPPTDLLLEQPTLRVGGVPVFWLPWVWLRSSRRVGLLPLKAAYLGKDGFLFGSGVNAPLSRDDTLELGAAAYVRGGVDLEGRLFTPETTTSIRWDYLRQSFIAADVLGAASPDSRLSVAWSVSALRGERALNGPILLEDAALREDRVRATSGLSDGSGLFLVGLTARADANRGGSLGTLGAFGPGAHAGFGAPLGTAGVVDADVETETLEPPSGPAESFLTEHSELGVAGHAGAVGLTARASSRALVTVEERSSGHVAAGGVDAEATLPLVKRLGSPELPLEHWITPFATGLAGAADSHAPSIAVPVADNGAFYAASAGVRTSFGETAGRRSAVSVSIRAGVFGEHVPSNPEPAVAWTLGGRVRFAALRVEGVFVAERPYASSNDGLLRIGAEGGPFLSVRASERNGDVPVLARLFAEGWNAPWVPWFSQVARTAGAGVGIPWTRFLTTAADADYDFLDRALLGIRGNASYRHPCGCLAVTLWGAHRLGRPGVDAWVAVDLMPR